MLGRLFSAYEGALLRRPLATKCAMSMAVLGTADACAQRLQHHNNPPPHIAWSDCNGDGDDDDGDKNGHGHGDGDINKNNKEEENKS